MREAYWLRSPMLRVLICKFGDKLKEIQISPEHGIHYVNLLRTDYLLLYGGDGVLEFFEWVGTAHHGRCARLCASKRISAGGEGERGTQPPVQSETLVSGPSRGGETSVSRV